MRESETELKNILIKVKEESEKAVLKFNIQKTKIIASGPIISGEGNGNPLQYCCLENSMDRGTWQAAVYGVPESWTWLSDYHSLPWKIEGEKVEAMTYFIFFWAPKSPWKVTAPMKLKDACSLEEKLQQT